jgi:hypothetical protein
MFDVMGDNEDKLVLVIEVTAAMKGTEKPIYLWQDFSRDFLCWWNLGEVYHVYLLAEGDWNGRMLR